MADGVISDLAKKVLGTLGKAAVKEAATWWRARDDLEKLKHRMAFIEARVRDAENRQEGENGELIKLWLRDLKVVLYRADDLFDLVLTVDRKNRKVESRMMAKVGVLFLKPFISAKDSGIFAHKIKSINDELEVIKSNMNDFNFIPNLALVGLSLQMQQLISRRQRETKSFVKAEDVIGRDNDKKTIVRMLFDPKYDEKRIAVFSILGYGGLGKTTLAQFVYNDETVRNRFDLTKWVCVPEVDDRNTVMRRVYHSLTGDKDFNKASYDDIILGIRGTIKGKKYLLVLDDIWDETRDNWLDLISILEDGANGSRVIITARTANAANAFGVTESHNLGLLTPDESWELFKKLAFKSKQEESNSILTQLGGEIVESCGNVPLAIRVVGCLLYPDNSEQHWRAIRDARLSKAKVQEVEDMMQVLKLSYDYLSPALKQCFAYCALFPTDYRYSKDRLVKMWMAQGYVDPSRVDIGEKYFMGLLGRSLFQDPEEDDEGNVTYCKMHDLVHLLAQNIASEEIVHDYPQDIASEKIGQLVESSNQVVLGNRLLHASFQVMKRKKGDEWEAPKSLLKARLMRSLILFSYNHNCDVKASSLKMMLLKFKSLRVLDLEGMNISTVPNSIGKLRHLRYLNLAWNNIKCLPDDITRLQNLQTLILECCSGLTELPRDFCKLDSLRHLGLVGSGLRDLPTGFEKLTSLEKLDLFIVGKYGDLHSLPALKLMGNLVIKFCSYSTSWAAQRAGLKNSLQLTRLTLLFEYERKYFAADMYEMIECLEMPPNLKYFVVEGYEGYKMPPKWLYGLSKLLVIRITSCENCRDLPRFSQLRHLKRLYLTSLGALKYVEEGGECSSRSRDAYFRSLEVLELQDLRDVEGWTRPTEDEPRQLLFPCLLHMKIVKCPKLMSMPLAPKLESLSADTFNWKVFESNLTTMEASSSSSSTTLFTSLKVLDISTIEDGPASLTISSRFSSLQKIDIASCKELTSLVIESSNSIRHLGISWCKSLENISLGNLSLLHALKIVECPKMAVLPQSLLGLPSLHTVYIRKCPALITRYNKRNGQDRRLLQHIPDADILLLEINRQLLVFIATLPSHMLDFCYSQSGDPASLRNAVLK